MNRPKQVRIGALVWPIHYLGWKAWEDHEGLDSGNGGETHAWDHTIWVATEHDAGKLDEWFVKEVTLHEIMHACAETTCINHTIKRVSPEDVEEAFIGSLSLTLLGVLQENPRLAAWLAEK